MLLFAVCGKDGPTIGCPWGHPHNGLCCWNSRYCAGITYLSSDVFFDNYLIWGVFRKLLQPNIFNSHLIWSICKFLMGVGMNYVRKMGCLIRNQSRRVTRIRMWSNDDVYWLCCSRSVSWIWSRPSSVCVDMIHPSLMSSSLSTFPTSGSVWKESKSLSTIELFVLKLFVWMKSYYNHSITNLSLAL